MTTVRKIDLVIQAGILGIAFLALIANRDYLYFIEPVIGLWQVASALFNSYSMSHEGNGYRRRILIYWIVSLAAVLTLALAYTGDVLFFVVTNLSWGIAVYYWILYFLFIQHMQRRAELSTVIRK